MIYPNQSNIDIAIQNISIFNRDPALKDGKPFAHNGRLVKYTGGFSMVYPIVCPKGKFALRCWYADVDNAQYRYQEIVQYLKRKNLEYFVEFNYVQNGLLVDGLMLDTVRMEWLDYALFKEFVFANLYDSSLLKRTAYNFLIMTKRLHQNNIAHGDLQHGNIMVSGNGELFLLDYDSVYVPSLKGEQDVVKGLKAYQHPARFTKNRCMNANIDYFSEWVIFLSLLALSEDASLWHSYDVADTEQLLFKQSDFLTTSNSPIFLHLMKMSHFVRKLTKAFSGFCKSQNLGDIKPVESFVKYTADGDMYMNSWFDTFIQRIQNVNQPKINKSYKNISSQILDKMFNSK